MVPRQKYKKKISYCDCPSLHFVFWNALMMCEVWKYICWQAGHPIIAIGPETSTEDMYMFRREDYFYYW